MSWIWRSVARPALTRRSPGAQAWEMARYRAYQTQLAGRTVGEVFERAEAFLERTAVHATSAGDVGASAGVALHPRRTDR